MTATDYADRHGHSVTIGIKAFNVPANQNWNDDPSPGQLLLNTFLHTAVQRQLVTQANPGTGISRDGTTFHFIINGDLYAGYQEESLAAVYQQTTGRVLRFERAPDYDDVAEVASEGIDWGGIAGGVTRFFGRWLDD